MQEAFIKAWRNIGRFRMESSFKSWLHRITVNTAMDYLRKQSRRKQFETEEAEWEPGLKTAELSACFEALSADLKLADNFIPPHRGADYGADVWQRISPRLNAEPDDSTSRLKTWLASVSQSRFSLTGALSFALVAVLAFTLGRNGGQENINTPDKPVNGLATALAGINPNRLLAHSVSGYLEQVNLVLTQFANTSETSSSEAEFA